MAVSPPQGSHARGTMLQSHDPPARQTGEVFMETRSTGRGHVLKVQRRATSWIVLRPQARRRIVLRKSAGRTPRGCAAPGTILVGQERWVVGEPLKGEGCHPPRDVSFSPLVSPVRAGPARPVPEVYPVAVTVSGGFIRLASAVLVLVVPAPGAIAGGFICLWSTPWTCCTCRQRDGHEEEKNRSDPECCSSLHAVLSPAVRRDPHQQTELASGPGYIPTVPPVGSLNQSVQRIQPDP
jgi:hypothetical protein